MTTFAILPLKSMDEAKRRLRQGLDPGPRRALVEAMFSDVLVALSRSKLIDEVLVVTADRGAQRIAGGYGAQVLDDDDQGHNRAASRGIDHVVELGAERVLLVAGDCPLISPAELDQLLGLPVERPSVLVVPDYHGSGTNALLLTPPQALAPSFGPDSHARHAREAAAAGVASQSVTVPSLALDVDTLADLELVETTLAETRGGAAHTRGMLRQMMRSQS